MVLMSCDQATESPEEPLRKIPCLVLLLHVRVRKEGQVRVFLWPVFLQRQAAQPRVMVAGGAATSA